jgi:RNA polymerase sigma-70 factor (ECF subfamily)
MGELTLTDMDRLLALDDAERTFQMDEETFRTFYEQTARPIWIYLMRLTGDRRDADDLLQETYYRFLRVRTTFADDDHRRRYLFQIATNLSRDLRRKPDKRTLVSDDEALADARSGHRDAAIDSQIDVTRAMKRLKPRERALLWLAYVQGWSHAEIAQSLDLRTTSLKALLWRARRRLLDVMKERDTRESTFVEPAADKEAR